MELAREQGVGTPGPGLDIYAIVPEASAFPLVFEIAHALRACGLSVQMHASGGDELGSMKSQFKKADTSGARYALVFGADELAQGEVTVKALRDGAQGQTRRALAQVAQWAPTLQSRP